MSQESINEDAFILDAIIRILHRAKYRRHHSVAYLMKKNKGFWLLRSHDKLQAYLDALSLNDNTIMAVPIGRNLKPIVVRITKGGKYLYKYNTHNYAQSKITKEALDQLKTEDELRENRIKEWQYKKLEREIKFYKDPKWIWGFISGAITIGLTWLPKLIYYIQHLYAMQSIHK